MSISTTLKVNQPIIPLVLRMGSAQISLPFEIDALSIRYMKLFQGLRMVLPAYWKTPGVVSGCQALMTTFAP